MYANKQKPSTTTIKVNKSSEGESMEAKVRRILRNKEAIKDASPLVFTERKDGVRPEYDIRADKFDAAVELSLALSNSHTNRREERIAEKTWDTMSDQDRQAFKSKYPNNPLSKGETQSTPGA